MLTSLGTTLTSVNIIFQYDQANRNKSGWKNIKYTTAKISHIIYKLFYKLFKANCNQKHERTNYH